MSVYRGVRDRTGNQDPSADGFLPHCPTATPGIEAILNHILIGTLDSPYISFSRSEIVARRFATNRGKIYEVELPPSVIDPAKHIRAWMVERTTPLTKDEEERGFEAISYAERDEEILFHGSIAPTLIKAIHIQML